MEVRRIVVSHLTGMTLVIAALVLLILPGLMFNNLSNSDLVNGANGVSAFAFTCPGADATNPNIVDVTCHSSANVGCQQATSVCTLSGSSISFLNQASPFTPLIQGNIFGFFGQLTSKGSTAGVYNNNPFQGTGYTTYIYANCIVGKASGKAGLQFNSIFGCTQTDLDNGNLTEANVNSWANWNPTQSATTKNLQFFHLGTASGGNATYPLSCSWDVQINYTAVSGNGWTYYGCTVAKTSQVVTNLEWTWLVAINNNVGALSGGFGCSAGDGTCYHRFVYIQLETWYTQGCSGNGLTGNLHTDACDQWSRSFLGYNIPGTTTSFVPNGGGPIFAFLIGLALFFIGLGVSVSTSGSVLASGGGAGLGFNSQGTRLAQAVGLGLIAWVPMYSEFSTWFTSGYFPYGLDGGSGGTSPGIIAIFLTGAFFIGIFWLMLTSSQSGD